jgi:hypothetical protein
MEKPWHAKTRHTALANWQLKLNAITPVRFAPSGCFFYKSTKKT